jgi:hypothetical protein
MRRLVGSLVVVVALVVPGMVVSAASSASATTTLAPLSGELLTGTDVAGTCPPPGDAGTVAFTATGTATGPYPGTFTETGYWELDLEILSAFHASFTIVSGSTTVTGTADYTTTASAFAACDGRAYNVPTSYNVTISAPTGTRTNTGTSSVNIVYGSFQQTFGTLPTLSVGISKHGTVTSDTGGINCSRVVGTTGLVGTCKAQYAKYTPVILAAVPATGKTFVKWGGACLGVLTPTCTVTMSANKTTTAYFSG